MTHYRNNPDRRPYQDTGFSLIEVLVTIVILLIGLLGLAGLQGRALTSQMESYQRSQALILLKDMVDRIETNHNNAAAYVTAGLSPAYLGIGAPTCTATGAGSAGDQCAWNSALLGAAETVGTSKVGAMIGARGCVEQVVAPASGVPAEYRVSVAWQGLNSTAAPAINCGINEYSSESLRRVVSLPVYVANLASP